MTSVIRQNPLIPMLICACGWLFGQGLYEMMRPVVLENVESGFNRVHSHDRQGANHEFVETIYTKKESPAKSKSEKIDFHAIEV